MARSTNVRNAFRPQLEALDGRLCPAITGISQNLSTGLAVVTANNAIDIITLTDRGVGGVVVSGGGLAAGGTTLSDRINRIQVNTNGSNDVVVYNVTGNQRRSMRIDANLGVGNDTFIANQNGFDVRNSSTEDLRVTGGSGADRMTINAAGSTANRVNVTSGSILRLQLSAGNDLDLLDRADSIAVNYQGDLDGKLLMRGIGGLGNDSLRATLTLDGGSSGSTGLVSGLGGAAAKASLEGGFGADTLDFRVRTTPVGGRCDGRGERWA